mgnify:CR=1 FL=1
MNELINSAIALRNDIQVINEFLLKGLAPEEAQLQLVAKSCVLLGELDGRVQRLDSSYRLGKPFIKLKFHDFTQTTLEQAGAGHDLPSYQALLTAAFARGNKPVRLIGVGVRLQDLRSRQEQLQLFGD